ncbi:MAG: hypothetical protein WC997_17670 [Porticoccaceae bacterium]
MASSHRTLLVLTAAAALATSQATLAQTVVSPPGRLLASNCFQYHGTHGNGPGFDKLAGVGQAAHGGSHHSGARY